MGGQHRRVDRPGLPRDTKGGRRHSEAETTGWKVIGGAPTTLRVKGLMMMMMMMKLSLCTTLSLQKPDRWQHFRALVYSSLYVN